MKESTHVVTVRTMHPKLYTHPNEVGQLVTLVRERGIILDCHSLFIGEVYL